MPRCYIAGGMTGLPKHNFPAFNREAKRLRKQGYEVINPAEVNPDPGSPWVDCMRADIKLLVDCNEIYMLPGWEKSEGASLEHHIAQKLKLKVTYL